MLPCYVKSKSASAVPLKLIYHHAFRESVVDLPVNLQTWVKQCDFKGKANTHLLLPNEEGKIQAVLVGIEDIEDPWAFSQLATVLPEGSYYIDAELEAYTLQRAAIGWGLGAYQFTRYKDEKRKYAKLVLPRSCYPQMVDNIVQSLYLVRDLINIPAGELGPAELASVGENLAKEHNANFDESVDAQLIADGFPAIHAVGRAAENRPRLIDITWGEKGAPRVTLVGKGVCFDTGGLNLKSTTGMAHMKKDMSGAAHALGLANMIMGANLPVRLRVLVPAVENAVSGNAYRPGDVIPTRKGLTVEITNTDAEGRVVLADALAEASTEKPDLLIDFSSLTGAARVALGTDVAAMFSEDENLLESLMEMSRQEQDPMWPLPIYQPYRKKLDSNVADMVNSASGGYGGAITAALFLKEFVDPEISWIHFDLMGYNLSSQPGRPEGGEAFGLRAIFNYIRQRFSAKH